MYAISDRFAAALPTSHRIAQRVEVLDGYNSVLVDLTQQGVFADGEVTASRSAIQRQARISLVDDGGTLTPDDIDELLTPAGNQIRLWRGVRFGDGTSELVPTGTFRFTTTKVQNRRIQLDEMYDRSWIVSGARTENTYNVPKGSQIDQVIAQILTQAYPGVPMNLPDTDEVTNSMAFDADSDPWELAQQLAANLGMRLFFDPLGVVQMADEPDPDTDPVVWTFDDTDPNNMMLPTTEQSWIGNSYNMIVVTGENSSLPAPVRGVAKDNDPRSPTRYGGPYGRRLAPIIRDDTIASQAQANARAVKELRAQLGLFQQASIQSMVNPAFEVGDVVYTSSPVSGINQYYIMDGFNVPMRAAGAQAIESRSRQAVPS